MAMTDQASGKQDGSRLHRLPFQRLAVHRLSMLSHSPIPSASRRPAILSVLVAVAASVIAGCASGPTGPASSGGRTYPSGRDGGPSQPPDNLDQIRDAEPRVEAVRPGGPNKPYSLFGRSYTPRPADAPFEERGLASWYGTKFHGQPTASGELYDMYAMTAAHPTLPIPSYARIRNPSNGREVVVRVNDRGPFHAGRIVDLSYTAAHKLGLLRGVAPVELERITPDEIRAGTWRRGTPGDSAQVAVNGANTIAEASASAATVAEATAPAAASANLSPVVQPVVSPVMAASALANSSATTSSPSATPSAGATAVVAAAPGAAPNPALGSIPATASIAASSPQPTAVSMPSQTSVPVASALAAQAAAERPVRASDAAAPASITNATVADAAPSDSAASALPGRPADAATAAEANSVNLAAAPAAPDSTPPQQLAKTDAARGFWVQLGAFRQRAGAEALHHRTEVLFDWVGPLLAVFSDRSLYRLQAGPYPTQDEARRVARRLGDGLGLAPVIVDKR